MWPLKILNVCIELLALQLYASLERPVCNAPRMRGRVDPYSTPEDFKAV